MFQRVWAEIDETALLANVAEIRRKTPPDTRIMAVVKADAYGHDMETVGPVLRSAGIDAFAVACVEEGRRLRECLRRKSVSPEEALPKTDGELPMILVLGYADPSEYETALRQNIDLTVFTGEQGIALSQKAQEMGCRARIHVKLETGMNRIGFSDTPEGLEAAAEVCRLPGIDPVGVFTHFARADETDKEPAARQQVRFEKAIRLLREKGIVFSLQHSANSAAIMEFPRAFAGDCPSGGGYMARAGIMLYGIYPSKEMDPVGTRLTPVMTLKTGIIHLKKISPGEAVGYGGSYTAKEERLIATVPIGYGDGYPRGLSNRGVMLVRGQRAPVVGRVCMDQTMLDVTDIPGVQPGDEVTVFGRELPVQELADQLGTIPYEIFCRLSERVRRVLVNPIDGEKG